MRSRGRKRCPSRAVQQRRHLGRVLCALMCRCVAAPSESVPEMDILFLTPAVMIPLNKLRFHPMRVHTQYKSPSIQLVKIP